jgi:hypothetical protein
LNNANDQDVHDWEKMKERMEYCASRNIKWYFLAYKGAKAKRSGMGELKDLPNDPLFSINHTLAMMRYGMSRLIRRTWNTTKKQKYLQHHLNVYMFYHNCIILREIAKKEEKAAQEKAAQELLQQKREQKHQLELEQRHLQA